MYVEVYDWNVLYELEKSKKVFAIDTKDNQVFDLLECPTKDVLLVLKAAREKNNRIMFYYWQEEDEENEQM